MPPVAVYARAGAHSCIGKALEILGHGSDSMRLWNDIGDLETMVEADRADGIVPLAIVGTAGCVNKGTYDDLAYLGDFSKRENIWLHVDAAFGFWILLADQPWRSLIRGIERACSIALDFHKWLTVPYAVGACLIRDRNVHKLTFSNRPAYLAGQTRGLAAGDLWFCDYGFDLSRPFHALKVWTCIKAAGTKRLGAAISDNCRQAALLGELVSGLVTDSQPEADVFLAAEVVSNVVVLRLRKGIDVTHVAAELQLRQLVVFSTTIIDGNTCLRAAFVNHRTTDSDIVFAYDQLLGLLKEI